MVVVVTDRETSEASAQAGIQNVSLDVFKNHVEKYHYRVSLLDRDKADRETLVRALRDFLDDMVQQDMF